MQRFERRQADRANRIAEAGDERAHLPPAQRPAQPPTQLQDEADPVEVAPAPQAAQEDERTDLQDEAHPVEAAREEAQQPHDDTVSQRRILVVSVDKSEPHLRVSFIVPTKLAGEEEPQQGQQPPADVRLPLLFIHFFIHVS